MRTKLIKSTFTSSSLNDEVEHCMNRDERTTSEVRLELHLNPFSFHETTSRYRVEEEDNWLRLTGKEGEYLAREFETYAVLLYPISWIPRELILSLNHRLTSVDKLRDVLMKPMDWKDFVTFRIREGQITSSDLKLENFLGRDLVNNVLESEGIEFVELDEGVELACKLESFSWSSLNLAFWKISMGLSLYFELKRYHEDVSLRLAQEYLSRFNPPS